MQIPGLLIGLSGLAVLPSFSSRRDQAAHLLLTAAVLAALPIEVTVAVTFLALNASCWTLAPHDAPRTRAGAAIFLGTQALVAQDRGAVHWVLAAASLVYVVCVAYGWFMGARGYISFFKRRQ